MSPFFFSSTREDGQTMPEYAVVLGIVVLGCVAAFTPLSGAISAALTGVAKIFG